MSLSSVQHLHVSAWVDAEGKYNFEPMGIINYKVILVMPFSELKQSRGISAPVEGIIFR